jgi:hypothetical protein
MKWKDNKVTELKGVNHIATIINDSSCIFNKIDGTNDVGIDGYIEFTENQSTTGLCIGVQIKSGDSNWNNGRIHLKSSKEHFSYWSNHILPICGVVYIPSLHKAYWVDITAYIKDNSHVLNEGPYQISVDTDLEFNLEKFPQFHKNFKSYKNNYSLDWNFGKALKLLASNNLVESRFSAIKALFNFHRNDKETWFYLIHHFAREQDSNTQKYLTYLMSHIVGHPDIFWHKNNIIEETTRRYAYKTIQQTFAQQETTLLITNIDENGIERGTIGQGIHAIIEIIPRRIDYLKNIIIKGDVTEEAKTNAAIIIIYEYQFQDKDRAIQFCDSMIKHFPNSRELFEIIKDQIQIHGEFAIY